MEVAKAAAKAGFDEIQFDFVRYPAVKLILEGVSLAEKRRRVATISEFLRQVTSTLRPYNVYVGATVLGSVCSTTQLGALGQHLEEVAAAVDYVSPLLYPSLFSPAAHYPMTPKYSYEVAHQNLEQAVARLGGNSKKLRPLATELSSFTSGAALRGSDSSSGEGNSQCANEWVDASGSAEPLSEYA